MTTRCRIADRREVAPVFQFVVTSHEAPSHLRAAEARDSHKSLHVTSHTEAGWISLRICERWTTESGRMMTRETMVTLDKESSCRLVDHLSAALQRHL